MSLALCRTTTLDHPEIQMSQRLLPLRLALITVFSSLLLFTAGCIDENDGPRGLRDASPSGGPRIVFDLDARPFPEIPFPNDLATRIDPDSDTGRRLNVSLLGGTEQEEKVRTFVNQMEGFGVYSPITVKFDSLLDLDRIAERHQEDTPDFRNDVVYLINVDPESAEYGKFELIDMGLGNYPVLMEEPDRYYDADPRRQGTNLLYESVREVDENGNGRLDPIEDTDDDGVWDFPNLLDQNADPYEPGNTLEWYERETNTLILRPVDTLQPGTTYAVVLTDELRGVDNNPVDSPFEFVNHARQTPDLLPLRDILPRAFPGKFDGDLGNVRFAWSFTTHKPFEDMLAVRAGLYGHGPFSRLAGEYPADLHMVHNGINEETDVPMAFDLEPLLSFLVPLLPQFFGVASGSADKIEENLVNIDYLVSGAFLSPYFLADGDGLADEEPGSNRNPQDDDEVIRMNRATGEAFYDEGEVTFMCTVPKTTETRKPPFPTVIYSHAINSTRLEILLFGGTLAKFGFAVCAIDAVGHGVVIPSEFSDVVVTATERLNIPKFPGVIEHTRARDLDNDGEADSGGMFFTSDILHSRDNFRQTAIDQFQFVRILRSFDGQKRWPDSVNEDSPWIQARRDIVSRWDQDRDGEGDIAGDFNNDGVVDFGGNAAFVGFGTSLGGIQSTLISTLEPTIRAASSNAGGGGLVDIAYRTTIRNARAGVILRMIGPLIIGQRVEDESGENKMRLYFTLATADDDTNVPIGTFSGIEDGDVLVLRNPNREARVAVPEDEKSSHAIVRDGQFRIAIASDADEATRRRAKLGFDNKVSVVDDLMGCAQANRCGEERCERGFACTDEGCKPIAQCIADFDPAAALYQDDPDTDRDESQFYPDQIQRRTVDDPRELGDPLIIEVYTADGELKQVIDSFGTNAVFENILYPEGAPLAAIAAGLGLKRQTPDFRRFVGIAQVLIEGADPAVAAPHLFENPLEFPYETPEFRSGFTNFLMAGTVGDQTVPISSSISIARTAGIVDTSRYDARYGKTENQFLIDNFVYEGIEWLDRFPDFPGTLFDADDLDRGQFMQPGVEQVPPNPDAQNPTRATIVSEHGFNALRLPYLDVEGEHTFNAPLVGTGFDSTTFMGNQVGWYLINRGHQLSDDACLVDNLMQDCEFYDFETFSPPDLFSCETGGCAREFR